MALTTKRIIALPSQTDPQEGDYLAIDNLQGGTHKIPVGRVGVEVDNTLTEQGKAADAKAVGDALDEIRSQVEATDDAIDEIRSQIEVTGTASGAIATFTDGSAMPAKSVIVNIEPQQSGTGTPSPENVRPISGWESVNVYKSGVNVWDEEWETGSIDNDTGAIVYHSSQIRSKNFIPTRPNVEYFFYCGAIAGQIGNSIPVYFYDSDKNYLGRSARVFVNNSSFTTPSNAYYMKFRTGDEYGATYQNDISINHPPTDTAYHPYDPDSRTTLVNLGRTVYGGEAEIVGGSLTDKMAIVDLGTLNWTLIDGTTGYFYTTIPALKNNTTWAAVPNLACEIYQTTYPNAIDNKTIDKAVSTWKSANRLIVRDTSYTDAASFKTAMSGVQLVYELAQPTTYQLTPTEVKTLLGENNVWADSGDVEVVYVRDLNIAINNLLNSNGTRSLGMMATSAPTKDTAEEPTDGQTEEPAEDDMR